MSDVEIGNLLERLEALYGVRILYACESGSRAWGFASPDSDFDIRFIYLRPAETYLSVKEHADTIERPLEGLLDAGGWDVRKALKLLAKSNGALVEWLHSPIIYRETPGFRERWQAAARKVFAPRASSDHYRGLARQMMKGKLDAEKVRAKDYLYAMRALLSAAWVTAGKGPPPVEFDRLLSLAPADVMAEIPGLLEYKARSAEGDRMDKLPVIDAFLESTILDLDEKAAGLARPGDHFDILDRMLREELEAGAPRPAVAAEAFSLDRVHQPDLLLFGCVAGSKAYGTDLPGSDEDRRGVFVAPTEFILGLDHLDQVSDERGDIVYYEVGRFVELLLKNNPNALELLGMPEDCIRHRHPLFDLLPPQLFLSKLCAKTFGEYAMGQIRKARGLNKKIVNPQPEQRLALLDFCHVPKGQGSVPVLSWLAERGIDPEACGLTAVQHAAGMYAIYHDGVTNYRGLVSPKDPDALVFSSVPIGAEPVGWMHCNHDAFQAHCKAHREYWEWVANRNEERYQTNSQHGRGYDSKNLMHTLRLLDMAREIATTGELGVRRPDREFLLRVRAGEFDYDELVSLAERKLQEATEAFTNSGLPDAPDREAVNRALVEIRRKFHRIT
ncbi:MAG: nucleotidyltransferase domain-containing protein [Akkermansiaceae bacterium]|nr:nucleotidyltransferase domain-containing protein [Akkermansiaceae bacterium]